MPSLRCPVIFAASWIARWCRERSKVGTRFDTPPLANDRLKIDIGPVLRRQTGVEGNSRLALGFPDFVGFERTLNDFGDRPPFPARETVGEFTRLGAADGKLRFGHGQSPSWECMRPPSCHQDGR